jgi:hypothetical protein
MELHAGVHTESHEPVTDEITRHEGILSIRISSEVKPYGIFPLQERQVASG